MSHGVKLSLVDNRYASQNKSFADLVSGLSSERASSLAKPKTALTSAREI